MTFRNREQAAHLLADKLGAVHLSQPLVLAIPRGGVSIGTIVAKRLEGDLDVVLVHKISPIWQRSLSIGVVAEDGKVFLNKTGHELGYTNEEPQLSVREELAKLHAQRRKYTPQRAPISPKGRSVVIVDDAIVTGETMRGAVEDMRWRGAHTIIAAAPVATIGAVERLKNEGIQSCIIERTDHFFLLNQVYEDSNPIHEDQAIRILSDWREVHSDKNPSHESSI